MEDFASFIEQQRAELHKKRSALMDEIAKVQEQVSEIDIELSAITAYEQAKTGKKATGGTRKRRAGVRDAVLIEIKNHPEGINRADLLVVMNAKDDKKAETSISNALSNLKKAGDIVAADGYYKAAG